MGTTSIVQVTIKELLENNDELLQKYFIEGHSLVTSYNVNKDAYYAMENANLLDTLVATNGSNIVGFICRPEEVLNSSNVNSDIKSLVTSYIVFSIVESYV